MSDLGSAGDAGLAFLLNALWQAAAVCGAAAALGLLLRSAPARHLHTLWLAAFLLAALLPWASLLHGTGRADRAPAPAAALSGADSSSPADGAGWAAWLPAGRSRRTPSLPPAATAALVLAWAGSVLVQAGRLARAWWWTRRLARGARPLVLSGEAAAIADRCHAAFGLRAVPLLGSDLVSGPVTLGARRACILLPAGFSEAAPPEQLTAALGHELAHVQRRDYAVHLLCEALFLPVAFHPAVRWVRRRLAVAREMACDEAAVERLMSARTFARSLLSMAAASAGFARPVPTLGALDADTLEVRMKSLTDPRPRLGALPARAILAMALLLLAGLGVAGSNLAVAAASAPAAAGLEPFLGVWHGDFPLVDKDRKNAPPVRLPGAELEVRTSAAGPEAILTMYRNLRQPDGSFHTDAHDIPVYDLRVSGRTLSFHTRYVMQFREGARKEILDNGMQLALNGDDDGVLSPLDSAHRRQNLPPPPPPLPMKRVR